MAIKGVTNEQEFSGGIEHDEDESDVFDEDVFDGLDATSPDS